MAKSDPNASRVETTLAFMAAGVVGFSLVDMLVTLLLRLIGISPWAILSQIPLIGLPAGFLLIVALLLASLSRRAKQNRNR